MKKFAIIGTLKPPRTDVVAIICGTLCSVAAALPAKSADFYPYPEYTGYGPGYGGYYRGCGSCGCHSCCSPCGHRPFIQPGPVVERHWDYWERHYPPPYPYRYYPSGYAGYPYPYPGGYTGSPYYPYSSDYAYNSAPRPRLGFGGVQYPPAPISYEYQTPPTPYEYQTAAPYDYRAPTPAAYDYQAAARPGYDYEPSPRPPLGIPGAYSSASYIQ
jgi:hypothetical protein